MTSPAIDATLQLAQECGATVYRNRANPYQPAVAFGDESWAKFCAALASHPAPDLRQAAVQIIAPHPALQHATFCYACHGDGAGALMVQGWDELCLLMEKEVACGPDDRWRDLLAEDIEEHWATDGNGVPFCWSEKFEDGSVCIYRLDAALSAPPAQEQAGQMVSDERTLRRLLCSVYAGPLAYMDDGEAHDSRAHPFIDFLRDAPDVIAAKMRERAASPVQQEGAAPKGEATFPEYGSTDFGWTIMGANVTDGDKRLMAMLVGALGSDHPAVDDLVALIFRARPATPARADAPIGDDARRLDWLEARRRESSARGFQWDSWTYDALQSPRTIREQIDAAMGAPIAAPAGQPAEGYKLVPVELARRVTVALEAGCIWAEGSEGHPRLVSARDDFRAVLAAAPSVGQPATSSEAAPAPVVPAALMERQEWPAGWTPSTASEKAPYCAKQIGPCRDGCKAVKVTGYGVDTWHGDCWRVKA
jgi:hypothetical protein